MNKNFLYTIYNFKIIIPYVLLYIFPMILLADQGGIDSNAIREHLKSSQPDVDMTVTLDNGREVEVPLGLNFFWPDA